MLNEETYRLTRFGDGLFETVRVFDSKLPLWPLHYQRLKAGAAAIHLQWDDAWTENFLQEQFLEEVSKVGHTNAKVRLTLYRKGKGTYTPETNVAGYFIDVSSLEDAVFQWQEKGLKCDIYREHRKPLDGLSNIKTANSLLYVLAANWSASNALDDAVLLNSAGRVAECTSSNLFLVKDGVLLTPLLSEGPLAGTMRVFLLKICESHGIPYHETRLSIEDMLNADELFNTNAIAGIRPIAQVGEQRFVDHKFTKKLFDILLDELQT